MATRTPRRRSSPNLRAVKPGDTPPAPPADRKTKPKTITQAAADGDHLALLRAMRARLAEAVEDPTCPPRDLAALTRRLDDVAKQIKAAEDAARQAAEEAEGTEDDSWDEDAI